MRVTGNFFASSFVKQANKLESQQYKIQGQISTGLRFQTAGEDPVTMRRVLDLQGENNQLDQYASNITALQDRATGNYNILEAIKKISDRASEIAVSADDLKSPAELQAYAAELNQMIGQAVDALNTKQGDRYLLGGTATGQKPFVVTTDSSGAITGVAYQGNTAVNQVNIASGAAISVDIPGENTTGTGARGLVADSRTGADFFGHLLSLRDHLLSGDVAAITNTDRTALVHDEENILYHISNNSAAQTRLETTATTNRNLSLSLQGVISDQSATDLTEAATALAQSQTAYQAALRSASGILGRSLLDYL